MVVSHLSTHIFFYFTIHPTEEQDSLLFYQISIGRIHSFRLLKTIWRFFKDLWFVTLKDTKKDFYSLKLTHICSVHFSNGIFLLYNFSRLF